MNWIKIGNKRLLNQSAINKIWRRAPNEYTNKYRIVISWGEDGDEYEVGSESYEEIDHLYKVLLEFLLGDHSRVLVIPYKPKGDN